MNELQLHTCLEQALAFVEEGKTLHAVQLYYRILCRTPRCPDTYLQLARVFLHQSKPATAERVLTQALSILPGNTEILLLLGDITAARGKLRRALRWYSLLRSRRLAAVHMRLGLVHKRLGDVRRAEVEFRTAIRLAPRLPQVHAMLGEILLSTRRVAEATAEIRRALRIDPCSAMAHRLLGAALLSNHRPAEAIEELELAVDTDPGDTHAWHLCGEALLRLRRLAEAEYCLTRALSLDPSSPDLRATFGFLCLQQGERIKARDAFTAALAWGNLHLSFLTPISFHGVQLHLAGARTGPCLSVWDVIFGAGSFSASGKPDCEVVALEKRNN